MKAYRRLQRTFIRGGWRYYPQRILSTPYVKVFLVILCLRRINVKNDQIRANSTQTRLTLCWQSIMLGADNHQKFCPRVVLIIQFLKGQICIHWPTLDWWWLGSNICFLYFALPRGGRTRVLTKCSPAPSTSGAHWAHSSQHERDEAWAAEMTTQDSPEMEQGKYLETIVSSKYKLIWSVWYIMQSLWWYRDTRLFPDDHLVRCH